MQPREQTSSSFGTSPGPAQSYRVLALKLHCFGNVVPQIYKGNGKSVGKRIFRKRIFSCDVAINQVQLSK